MSDKHWGSRLGIIAAVAGSAIGLGNFLRFPSVAAQNGGGAFMIPYFGALILLGIPLMWVEWTTGRFGGGFGHSTAPGMFHSMWEKNRFVKYFGVIGIFGPVIIFIYYIYIESWLLGYSLFAVTGKYAGCRSAGDFKGFLHDYIGVGKGTYFSGLTTAYVFFVATFALNLLVLYHGVRRGIERLCKWALPVLMALGVVLMVRVMTLGTPDPLLPENNVANGFGFLWNPHWSDLLNAKVWLAAAGQIFFTLSVGIGVILTYASYLKKDDDVALSGLTAASANEVAEVVLGGSIVIPAAFAFFGAAAMAEIARSGTFNLGFVTMPQVLNQMPMSALLGFCWFALLFLAGITSSISLAEPAIAFLEDEFSTPRRKAVLVFGVATFILTQPCIFFIGHGVVDELDFWAVNVCLVGFALLEVILFAWVFGMDRAWTELHAGSDITIPRFYRFIIRYVTPLILIAILGTWLYQEGWSSITMKGVKPEDQPYVIATRLGLLALLGLLAFLVARAWKSREKTT